MNKFNVTLRLNKDDGRDMAKAGLTSLNFRLSYHPGIVKPDWQKLTIINPNRFDVPSDQISVDEKSGRFSFDLVAKPGNIINDPDGMDLVRIPFLTFLPKQSDSVDFSPIQSTVTASSNFCIDISGNQDTVQLKGYCAYPLRWVAITGQDYYFNSIKPNPVDGNGANLEFSVGLEDYTEIVIYNSVGEIVLKPVEGNYKPGEYKVRVPVELLPSGVYMCQMKSGPFTATQKMVVTK
jgi:hypothetical protein